MKARLIDFSRSFEGKQRVTIELETDFREGWQALRDSEVEVSIKKWRKRRSMDANAYAWVLIDKIAAAIGAKKEDVYRLAIREIGGVSEIVCVKEEAVGRLCESWRRQGIGWQAEPFPSKLKGCVNVMLHYGSSVYDAEQMRQLIDNLVSDAKLLGIETLTPEQLAAMEIYKKEEERAC